MTAPSLQVPVANAIAEPEFGQAQLPDQLKELLMHRGAASGQMAEMHYIPRRYRIIQAATRDGTPYVLAQNNGAGHWQQFRTGIPTTYGGPNFVDGAVSSRELNTNNTPSDGDILEYTTEHTGNDFIWKAINATITQLSADIKDSFNEVQAWPAGTSSTSFDAYVVVATAGLQERRRDSNFIESYTTLHENNSIAPPPQGFRDIDDFRNQRGTVRTGSATRTITTYGRPHVSEVINSLTFRGGIGVMSFTMYRDFRFTITGTGWKIEPRDRSLQDAQIGFRWHAGSATRSHIWGNLGYRWRYWRSIELFDGIASGQPGETLPGEGPGYVTYTVQKALIHNYQGGNLAVYGIRWSK